MTIVATFTGTNSLGYETGKGYVLTVQEHGGMSIERHDGTGHCVYGSLSAFLNNWSNIQVIKK